MTTLVPPAPPRVVVDGSTLDGGSLLSAAAAVADRVHGAAVVAIEADASLATVVAVVGCLLAGSTLVPVPPGSGPRERAHILRDSGAVVLLTGAPESRSRSADASPSATSFAATSFAASPDTVETVPVDVTARSSSSWAEPSDGAAMILYTSGTTGSPKGAVLSRAAIAAGLDGLIDAWAWTPDDTLVHGLPLFHVHGLVLGVLGALRAGSPLVHTGRPTPAAYAAASGTLYFGVPTVWGRVAADPAAAAALRPARLLVSGSAGLPAPVFAALESLTGQGPVERYGMTETLITLAARVDAPRRVGWVGTPLAGVSARVLDEAGRPVVDAIGDLQVRGATLFDGYLGRGRPLTDDGWFATGDAALVDADGQHRIVGRAKDDLIKSGGYRIGAGEIEACLLAHPSVSEVAVIGVPDDDLGQRIVAYVVVSPVSPVSPDALIEHVSAELSRHKRPREVRVVTELPRNALGKIQKSRLTH